MGVKRSSIGLVGTVAIVETNITPKGYAMLEWGGKHGGLTVKTMADCGTWASGGGGVWTPKGIPADAKFVMIQAETDNVRWSDDLQAATLLADAFPQGNVITAGYDIWYVGDLELIKLIGASAASVAHLMFYSD